MRGITISHIAIFDSRTLVGAEPRSWINLLETINDQIWRGFSCVTTLHIFGGQTVRNTSLNYSNSDEYAFLTQEALQQLADMRAQNGAEMSRINFAQDLLNINAVNLEAANSRIMDVDVAAESSQLARFQILQQAGTAMLAQANTSQQALIRLLQG